MSTVLEFVVLGVFNQFFSDELSVSESNWNTSM